MPHSADPSQLLRTAAVLCRRWGIAAQRTALGVVYIWFGALKLFGDSPAADLVRQAAPFPTPSWFVEAVGAFEVVLGLWLMAGAGLLYAAPVFALHMAGTFAVLVFLPDQAYQHGHVWELTMTGEFVVKNLVLLTAGLLACLTPGRSTQTPLPDDVRSPAATATTGWKVSDGA